MEETTFRAPTAALCDCTLKYNWLRWQAQAPVSIVDSIPIVHFCSCDVSRRVMKRYIHSARDVPKLLIFAHFFVSVEEIGFAGGARPHLRQLLRLMCDMLI